MNKGLDARNHLFQKIVNGIVELEFVSDLRSLINK